MSYSDNEKVAKMTEYQDKILTLNLKLQSLRNDINTILIDAKSLGYTHSQIFYVLDKVYQEYQDLDKIKGLLDE